MHHPREIEEAEDAEKASKFGPKEASVVCDCCTQRQQRETVAPPAWAETR